MNTDRNNPKSPQILEPTWPAPKHIKAFTTTRMGGFSKPPFDSFNLGNHVNDDVDAVLTNRQHLYHFFNLPSQPLWLNQVYGTEVAGFTHEEKPKMPRIKDGIEDVNILTADASVSFNPNQVCVVLTADCLPLLICNKKGSAVAAIHAGWRGLAAGVIEATIEKMYCTDKAHCRLQDLLVWLGPAIGPDSFEVGEEVLSEFLVEKNNLIGTGFRAKGENKFLADIYHLARQRLHRLGIPNEAIFGGDRCTFREKETFYSYRRDKVTGRMASLIWIAEQ